MRETTNHSRDKRGVLVAIALFKTTSLRATYEVEEVAQEEELQLSMKM